ncbi:MAG: SDR family NAD(P)-dependent oxidoreductase [Chthoniobacterales bacterium]
MSRYLVTGGCGFVGSNIAATLLREGGNVVLFDSLSRKGTAENLQWLQTLGQAEFVHGDIRNWNDVDRVVQRTRPSVIFHLAGQVAMTTSMNDPRRDYEVNVTGSINVLESVRQRCPEAAIVYSSSNKVYGNLAVASLREEETRYTVPDLPNGIDESAPLDFHTPYGCSKGAADQYMLDYARCFGLNTAVFRHSTIYGGRQFATFDQGWVGWFCQQAVETQIDPERAPFTIAGDGKQVRDLLFVDDAVRCYLAAAENIGRARGEAFNIGGGMENSSSLLELFDALQRKLGVKLRYEKLEWRMDDQKLFVADIRKATELLGWRPLVGKDEGVNRTIEWVKSTHTH